MGVRTKILIVDDEPIVLEVTRLSMEMLGRYEVCAYGDPRRALDTFKADPAGFAVIITDFKMPRMNGAELAVEIRRICPMIPIICISAFLKPEQTSDNLFDLCLAKPFDVKQLQEAVMGVAEKPFGAALPGLKAAHATA